MRPINPETSTKEKPIKDQRIKVLLKTGFLLILKINIPNISPTPVATPANEIKGTLDAK